MGEVVALRSRVQAAPVVAEQSFIELQHAAAVGDIRIVFACDPGCEDSGPYKIVLKTEGVPDRCMVTMTADPSCPEQLMPCLLGYAEAMMWTLRYAADNVPALCAPTPKPPGAA